MFISCLATKFKMQVMWMTNLLQMHWELCCTKTPAVAGSEASRRSIVLLRMEKLNKTKLVYSVNCVTMNRWKWEVYKGNWACTECQCILSDLHVAYWLIDWRLPSAPTGYLQIPPHGACFIQPAMQVSRLSFTFPLTQYVHEQLLLLCTRCLMCSPCSREFT